MPGKLNVFNLGSLGVDLTKSPLHIPDGAWRQAQNAEFPSNLGEGGLKKRGSLLRINSGALAGGVQALINAPFPLYAEQDLMLGLNGGETPTWKKSVDGTTFTNLTSATLERLAGQFTALWGTGFLARDPRSASFQNQFYYMGDSYVVGSTAPPLVVFNGVLSYEQFRVPTNPTSAGVVPNWIADLYMSNGVLYLGVWDPGGVAPDQKGRVLSYDPSDGVLLQVGNRFGNGSGENTAGFPFCLANAQGYLYAGTFGVSGNNQGKIWRIQPDVDTSWTLDHTATLHNGYYMSLCAYQGNLFAATDADSSGTAVIEKRTSAGVWSTSLSAPASNIGFFCSLIVFDGNLYAGFYNATTSLIKKYDGTTWTTDKNVGSDISVKTPGHPFIFKGALYWPFYDQASDSSTTGFLLKRTTGGVWTSQLSGVGVRGGVGLFVPAP